jgi:hypothetical protein
LGGGKSHQAVEAAGSRRQKSTPGAFGFCKGRVEIGEVARILTEAKSIVHSSFKVKNFGCAPRS